MSAMLRTATDTSLPSSCRIGDGSGSGQKPLSPAPAHYIIYVLRERATERSYVGLTSRSLQQRVSAHLSQSRRDTVVRDAGLMAALQRTCPVGTDFVTAWDSRVLARTDDVNQARALERHWIATLSAASPQGYNLMPGGASVGGPGNALPITVTLSTEEHRHYASIHDAIADLDRTATVEERAVVTPATVYYRLSQGWSAAEAFGYAPRQDRRGRRDAFQLGNQTYTTLREAAADTGLCVGALRSRLHRRRVSESESDADLGHDARQGGTAYQPRRGRPLGLRLHGVEGRLTAAAYAARTGLSKSTVIYRWHAAVRDGLDPGWLSTCQLFHLLVTCCERRKVLTLTLPDGRSWSGGERELIRRLMADADLEASRAEHLSVSGIRRRLRTLAVADRGIPGCVAWAFGFQSKEP